MKLKKKIISFLAIIFMMTLFLDNSKVTALTVSAAKSGTNIGEAMFRGIKAIDNPNGATTSFIVGSEVKANSRPIISAEDVTVEAGDNDFSLLDLASINDAEDGIEGLSVSIKDDGNFDVTKTGKYTIIYESNEDSDGNTALDKTIIVTVVDTTKPITTVTSKDDKVLNPELILVSATDNSTDEIIENWVIYDLNMQKYTSGHGPVVNLPWFEGKYTLVATATDKSGNISDEVIFEFVIDLSPPTITATNDTHTVKVGYSETLDYKSIFGYDASDRYDPNINADSVEVIGTVDFNKLGTYPLTLSVTDESGNTATKAVNVIVAPLTISGIIFDDLNYNSKNDDDSYLEDITLNLVDNETDEVIATTTSKADGSYIFEVPIGSEEVDSYAIKVEVPTGYALANPTSDNSAFDSMVDLLTQKTDMLKLSGEDYSNINIGLGKDLGISLNPLSQRVYVGDTVTSNLTVNNGRIKDIKISDESIINVDSTQNIEILAKKEGIATVSITFENGYQREAEDITREIKVEVLPLPTIKADDKYLIIGEESKHTYTKTPTDGVVTFKSSDSSIASIDQNGIIKGHKVGSVVIETKVVTNDDDAKEAVYHSIVTVGQEKNPGIGDGEAIDSIDFTIWKKEIPNLDAKFAIEKGKAKAWSTEIATLNKPIEITNVKIVDVQPNSYSTTATSKQDVDIVGYKYAIYSTANNTSTVSKITILDDGSDIDIITPTEPEIPRTGNGYLLASFILSIAAIVAINYRKRQAKN